MSSKNPKLAVFEQFALVAKGVAHPHRLVLLEQLAQGERSVEVLADRTRMSIANASQHLQSMRRAGLIASRRHGKFVFYRLANNCVLDLLAAVRRIAELNIAEMDQVIRAYFQNRDDMEPVSRLELMDRLKAGLVTVLDVRPEDEFALGHVPGAINIQVKELKKHLANFERRQEIVAYCRGPYCVLSYEAVAMLRASGFNARRLEDGLPEWRAAGYPVDVAEANR
jgi:rhodanese-related sulfurtransferase